jgi:hypothetical protein
MEEQPLALLEELPLLEVLQLPLEEGEVFQVNYQQVEGPQVPILLEEVTVLNLLKAPLEPLAHLALVEEVVVQTIQALMGLEDQLLELLVTVEVVEL